VTIAYVGYLVPISHFGFIAPKMLNYLSFQSLDFEVPDEGYSRNVLCALNLISTFLLPVSMDCPFFIAPSVFSYVYYICDHSFL
jgi:hypothetical protein